MGFWKRIPHIHGWKEYWRRGDELRFRCSRCAREKAVTLTPEQKVLAKTLRAVVDEDAHGDVGDFLGKVMSNPQLVCNWDRISAALEWVKKNRGVADIAWVDDDMFMTSLLVFIRCGSGDNFRGTRVVYLPQMEEDTPQSFWLYPGAAYGVSKALDQSRRAAFNTDRRGKPKPEFDVVAKNGLKKRWYRRCR